jgi:hypothetical protein
MGQFFFFLAVIAACLLWSAALTAAAARSRPGWIRWLLLVVALVVPPLALAPWLVVTGRLVALRFDMNWFAATLTAVLSAVIGGLWIVRAGLSPRAAPAAAAWPLVGLATLFVLAKAVAVGTLLFIDNAVAAEGRMLRVEAAQIMATALPPVPAPDDNAALLYRRAFAAIGSDATLSSDESPVADALAADPASPEVAELLARHAATLDLLRRAAAKPDCRFDRDWSRPSFDMLLPELQEMRQAARLLALSARKAAADGDGAGAVADIVCVHRLGTHAASEPILVSELVGRAIDAFALEALVAILPRLDNDDLPLLDGQAVRDFIETPITYRRAFLGEEACGLAMLADLADWRGGLATLDGVWLLSDEDPLGLVTAPPLALFYRCFLLPADVAGYRRTLRRYRTLSGELSQSAPRRYAEIAAQAAEIEDELESRRPGLVCGLLAPTLTAVLRSQVKDEALHEAAGVLVDATRSRLADGSLPETLAPLPEDPFAADRPLTAKRLDNGWLVYSVGPDGEDDGGPLPAGGEPAEGNDDVGLWLAL